MPLARLTHRFFLQSRLKISTRTFKPLRRDDQNEKKKTSKIKRNQFSAKEEQPKNNIKPPIQGPLTAVMNSFLKVRPNYTNMDRDYYTDIYKLESQANLGFPFLPLDLRHSLFFGRFLHILPKASFVGLLLTIPYSTISTGINPIDQIELYKAMSDQISQQQSEAFQKALSSEEGITDRISNLFSSETSRDSVAKRMADVGLYHFKMSQVVAMMFFTALYHRVPFLRLIPVFQIYRNDVKLTDIQGVITQVGFSKKFDANHLVRIKQDLANGKVKHNQLEDLQFHFIGSSTTNYWKYGDETKAIKLFNMTRPEFKGWLQLKNVF